MSDVTDRLRRMLDERGVKWHRTPHYSSESIDNETVFRGEGIDWIANDHLNGHIGLRALRYEVTPEQAIAATLGSCNCSNSERTSDSDATGERQRDAVEVVRCKDCESATDHCEGMDIYWCEYLSKHVGANTFCAWGKRRESE